MWPMRGPFVLDPMIDVSRISGLYFADGIGNRFLNVLEMHIKLPTAGNMGLMQRLEIRFGTSALEMLRVAVTYNEWSGRWLGVLARNIESPTSPPTEPVDSMEDVEGGLIDLFEFNGLEELKPIVLEASKREQVEEDVYLFFEDNELVFPTLYVFQHVLISQEPTSSMPVTKWVAKHGWELEKVFEPEDGLKFLYKEYPEEREERRGREEQYSLETIVIRS
ncbi:hypothetical protein BJ878DRAFT_572703 [Calycina marina]|uniref:Uncharacterized protein n=1 Tax=Calycina marina TaxID=1763456 RepID=A0A9P7ZAD6_9HELO|nr:hypothetical protein BJ878DRAFT_572703 [Calycina marina]